MLMIKKFKNIYTILIKYFLISYFLYNYIITIMEVIIKYMCRLEYLSYNYLFIKSKYYHILIYLTNNYFDYRIFFGIVLLITLSILMYIYYFNNKMKRKFKYFILYILILLYLIVLEEPCG
jgi:hypothetical protein